ncbi:AraC family transcriptional regulator, partial [Erwinia amylovora]|nr:AraC family transcriptional regulator [Erwinia amylovora]
DEFDFLDVVPDARHDCEQILNTSLFSQQIALFNTWFTPRLARKSSAVTRSVIRTITPHTGNLRFEQLSALSVYTCLTIPRHFRQDTGLSPKAFVRMFRCQ